MAHAHIAFSLSAKKYPSYFFQLSAAKHQDPMKFQNEMANMECTEFSKIVHSSSCLMQQLFLQVSYSLWSSVYKYSDARLRKHYYSFSSPGAQIT